MNYSLKKMFSRKCQFQIFFPLSLYSKYYILCIIAIIKYKITLLFCDETECELSYKIKIIKCTKFFVYY